MSQSAHPGRSFRHQLAKAARELRPAETMRILAKRLAPLMRHGEQLGVLQVLLRLTFGPGSPARGVLVLEWPVHAQGHSSLRVVQSWVDRAGAPRDGAAVVSCRDVLGTGGEPAARHLKVEFDLTRLSEREEMDDLLALAARVGLADVLADVESVENQVERQAPSRPAPAAPGGADAIEHNAPYDPRAHPHVSVNDEVTSSTGATFRLVTKRIGGQPRRVWIRVSKAAAKVSRAG